MSAARPLAPAARRVSRPTTLAYASGAIAYGIKDSGFGTFLLLFYNQVIGVAPETVGLIIMAALVLDAFIDPAVGALSDRTRGRWGRRGNCHGWLSAPERVAKRARKGDAAGLKERRGRAMARGVMPAKCYRRGNTGETVPASYLRGTSSILAAQMKSFSDRPLMAWVVNCTRH